MKVLNKLLHLITENANILKTENVREQALKEFGRCSEEQASIIISTWHYLASLYGIPDCIQYASNKAEHIKGLEPFSLFNEFIRFNIDDGVCEQILIRLARSTTPGCDLRDPLLVYKYADSMRESRLLILKDLDITKEFLSLTLTPELSEFEMAPVQIKRKSSNSCIMTFSERTYLWPKFKGLIKDKYKYINEFSHEQGSVDVHLTSKSNNKKTLVELKYINNNENPLNKLRMAIGQILMYKHDSVGDFCDYSMWIVINNVKITENVRKSIEQISSVTGIAFKSVRDNCLVDL